MTSGHRPVLPTTATGSSAGESASGDPRAPMDGDAAPVTLGRYRIGKLLGAGGMGSVYEAYDPELERVVAVKVLREDREATISRERRLVREAKVMARLAHPNVMRVYDVGVAEGRVYLAMEHVQGVTLEHWLAREPRSVAEILGSFAAAGQGLAAAHDAGLVHRDFKPSHVMVSDDGRVLVTDFGLARSVSDLEPADGDVEDARAPAPAEPTVTVTHSGVKVGTPQYMAPEQRAAGSVDARADQFSFCVSVWDALYGALPYSDGAAYARGETALRSPSGPNAGRVPNVVARALVRGLSVDPAARHPNMRALLAALSRDPARTRRRWALSGSALIAVAALGALGSRMLAAKQVDPCAGGAAKAASVWDASTRAKVEAAFDASGLAYAKPSFAAVAAALDAYAQRWTGMYQDACMATRVRGEQSDELLDLRMACLTNHLRETGAFTKLLESADRQVIDRAPASAQNLPTLDDCANVALLRGETRLPTDPQSRAAIDEVRGALADARALEAAGRIKEGLAKAGPLADRAADLHYRPLEADVLLTLGTLHDDDSNYASAVPTLQHAVLAATAGRSPLVAAEAQVRLANIIGFFQERVKDGEPWADAAEASLEAEGNDPAARIELLLVRSNLAAKDTRFDEALAFGRDAVERSAKLHGENSLEYAKAIGDVGNVLLQRGSAAEALPYERRALAIKEAILGPGHPQCAWGWQNIGAALHEVQDNDGALDAHQHALAIDEAVHGHDNLETARDLDNIGIVLHGAGKAARAEPYLRDALAIKEKLLPPDDVEIAFTLDVLGSAVLTTLGRYSEARPMTERALAIQTAAAGPDAFDTADMERHAVPVLLAVGDRAAARKAATAAVAVYEAKLDAKSEVLARGWLALASVQRADGDRAGAARNVRRALGVYDADPEGEQWTTEARLELADALWSDGVSMRARAREVADKAAERARAVNAKGDEVATAERWLAAHRG